MAPELLNKTPYRTSVDWWALGCSIYEMVCGYTPFKGIESQKVKIEKEEVQRRIQNEEPKYDHKFLDANTKDVIQQFLKKKIEERLGMKYVMDVSETQQCDNISQKHTPFCKCVIKLSFTLTTNSFKV